MSARRDKKEDEEPLSSNDFVIREGFPALRLPGKNRGPWIEGDEPLPRHKFWAQPKALEFPPEVLDRWHADCETVFSARAKDDGAPYSAGVTYFCPSQMLPRCALEGLVLDIFRLHTQGLEEGVMIPEQSGAEWWTLVLDEEEDEGKAKGDQDRAVNRDEDDEEEGDEVGLHFDADYGLEDQAPNLMLHPRVATVTYLSDYGAPTVVFDRRSPPPNDTEKKTLQGSIRRGWLSHPTVGKHIAFDGRLLHGAPATFFPPRPHHVTKPNTSEPPPVKKAKLSEQRKRITILVNVWVNHCPLDAELLDDEICEQLLTPWGSSSSSKKEGEASVGQPSFVVNDMDLSKPTRLEKVRLEPCPSDPAGEEETVICSRIVTVKYGASMESFRSACSKGELLELDFADNTLLVEVGDEVQDSDGDEGNTSE